MKLKMGHAGVTIATLMIATLVSLALASPSQLKIIVEHNAGNAASGNFKFKNIPTPARDDVAARAKLSLVVGERDPNGAELSALTDGLLPVNEDEPGANFFFNAGSDGGRFRLDLGSVIEVAQVNTYSWHASTRGPQIYNLYASDGTDPKFNAAPDGKTDPAACGWKLIASVDSRPKQGDSGGQYGVSITDSGGILGKYRYLLFDCVETETEDPWGNTFYSEVDVLAKK